MKTSFLKLLAVFLCAAMLLSLLPAPIAAHAAETPDPASVPALTLDTPLTVSITTADGAAYVSFTPAETNQYAFYSSATENDPRAGLYEELGGSRIAFNDDAEGGGRNFRLEYNLTAGKTYYYACDFFGSSVGSYPVTVSVTHKFRKTLTTAPTATQPGLFTSVCTYDGCTESFTEEIPAAQAFTDGGTLTIPAGDPNVLVPVTFSPESSHAYRVFSSDNGNKSILVRRYAEGAYLYSDYDANGEGRNVDFTQSYEKGKTYVFFFRPLADAAYKATLEIKHNYDMLLSDVPTATQAGTFTYVCRECRDTYREAIPPALILTEETSVTIPAGDPDVAVPVLFNAPVTHEYYVASSDNNGASVSFKLCADGGTYLSSFSGGGENGNIKVRATFTAGVDTVLFCKPDATNSYKLSLSRNHNYAKTLTTLPTPSRPGAYTFKCTECDASYEESIPAATEIRCDETLTLTGVSDANEAFIWFAPTADHQYALTSSEYSSGKDPNCRLYNATSPIYIKYDDDGGTNYNFRLAAELEAGRAYVYQCGIQKDDTYKVTMTSEHDYACTLTKMPTTTEQGEFSYACKYCDHSYVEAIPAAAEITPDGTVTVPAGEDGALYPVLFRSELDHYYRLTASKNQSKNTTCAKYDAVMTSPETFKSTSGFSFERSYFKNTTTLFLCNRIPDVSYEITLTPKHYYGHVISALPTETAPGEYTDECPGCGDSTTTTFGAPATPLALDTPVALTGVEDLNEQYLTFTPAATHKYVLESTLNVNCDPYASLYATVDGEIRILKSHDDIDGSRNRNFRLEAVLEAGKTYCFFCRIRTGESYTVTLSAPHTYQKKLTKAPTTSAAGEITYTCENKDHSYTEPIPAAAEIVPGGSVTIPAGAAGEVSALLFRAPLTHRYKLAAAGNGGEETSCELCLLGYETFSTYTGNGDTTGFAVTLYPDAGDTYLLLCKKLPGRSYTVSLLEDHFYNEAVTKLPTATENGVLTFSCTNKDCSASYTEVIDKATAIPTDGTVTVTGAKDRRYAALIFTAATSHDYVLQSVDNASYSRGDPKVYLFEQGNTEALFLNDDGGSSYHFKLEAELTAGKTYVALCRVEEGKGYDVTLSSPHVMEKTLTKAPTATETGLFTCACKYCDRSYTEEIPKALVLTTDSSVKIKAGDPAAIVPVVFKADGAKHIYTIRTQRNGGATPSATFMKEGESTVQQPYFISAGKYWYTYQESGAAEKTLVFFCAPLAAANYEIAAQPNHNTELAETKFPTLTEEGYFLMRCTMCDLSETTKIPRASALTENAPLQLAGSPDVTYTALLFTPAKTADYKLEFLRLKNGSAYASVFPNGDSANSQYCSGTTPLTTRLEAGQTAVILCTLSNSATCSVKITHVHDYVKTYDPAPTCTTDGVGRYTCSVCGDFYTIPMVKRHTDADSNGVCDICGKAVMLLDAAIAIDTTGSMGSNLASIRKKINAALDELENGGVNYRLALVDYRDFSSRTDTEADYPYRVGLDFTKDTNAVVRAVNSLSLGHGGDGNETVYSALINGLRELSWSPVSVKTVVLIGDAPALDPEPFTNLTENAVKLALMGVDTTIEGTDTPLPAISSGQVIQVNTVSTGNKSEPIPLFQRLADATGGGAFIEKEKDVGDILIGIFHDLGDDAHFHTPQVVSEGTAATCTEPGKKAKIVCAGCGETLQNDDPIPVLGHLWEQKTDAAYLKAAATCTDRATYYESCARCGIKGGGVFAVGETAAHTWTNKAEAKYLKSAATETARAVYYKSCSVCGVRGDETFEDGAPVGHTAHTWTDKADAAYLKSAATCTAKAVYYKSCSVCGAKGTGTFESGSLAAHTWADKADAAYLKSAATCTAKAVYYKSCSVCGAKGTGTFESGSLAAHTWADKVDATYLKSAATCTAKAVYYKSCSVCGAKGTGTFESGSLAAHTWADKVDAKLLKSAATCTAKAVYYKSCSVCGAKGTGTFESGSLAAHTWADKVDAKLLKSAATCTAKAVYYKSCSVCGAKGTGTFESGAALGHKQTYTQAADTHTPVCSVCKTALGAAEAHAFGKGTLTKAPVGKTLGTMTYKCTVCGYEKAESFLLGDVDLNKKIEAADARLALRQAVNLEHFEAGSMPFIAADADRKNGVQAADARLILRAAVGLEELK